MAGINLRLARREDCKEIRNLIQELADEANIPEGPKIDAETLERDGFGDNPLFFCIVAEENDKLIGYTFYSFQYMSWSGRAIYLTDLYVIPTARNKGIGSLLFEALAKTAVEKNCAALNFSVLADTPSADFYKRRGAIDRTEMKKFHSYRVFGEPLKKLSESSELKTIFQYSA